MKSIRFEMSILVIVVAALMALAFVMVPRAHAQGASVFKVNVGANAAWLESADGGSAQDVEGVAQVRGSLQPHVTVVANVTHGFKHGYTVPEYGFQSAVSDNDNFTVSARLVYRGAESILGPKEWVGGVVVGARPWAAKEGQKGSFLSPVSVGAEADVGTESRNAGVRLWARRGASL